MFNLKNKTAIITGAAGYLGKSICGGLLEYDCDVILFGRGNKIIKLYKYLQNNYRSCKVNYYDVDLYDTDKFKFCLRDSIKDDKKIDILINNAFDFSKDTGFNDESGRFENISKEQWLKSLESGLYWPFLTIQIIGEQMKKQEQGSIINISSMYGLISPDPSLYENTETFNPPTYSTVKSGLFGLTKYAASFYGKYGVRCNSISPGPFPNIEEGKNKPDNKVIERLIKKIPLKRVGKPEDLKGAIVFLSSDCSSFVNGANLVVDGGFTII